MGLAEVTTTILDGALELSPQDLTAISAAVGAASSGTVNTIVKATRARDATDTWSTGPLPEKVAYHIARSKKPVYGMRLTASVAGTTGSITKSNASSPTITASGTPRDTYSVIFRITQNGTVASGTGSGAYEYSVDGGDAFTPEIAIPAASEDLAQVTGTVDLTTGGLYGGGGTLNGTGFSIDVGGGAQQVTFSSPANAAAVLAAINTATGETTATLSATNRLVLSDGVSIVLAAGSPSGALTLLGLTAGTTNATPGTSTITLGDTGLTLTLPQGNYTAGDTYTFTTTEPNYSLANLTAGLDVFMADSQKTWFLLHVVGAASSAANARAMADVLATYAEDAEAAHRYMFFVMETPASASKADLKTAFASFESTRVAVSFGYEELTSEATRDGGVKRVFSRAGAWADVMRWAEIPISEKAAYVGRGKLEGVVSVDATTLDAAEEMSDARFLARREVIGKAGYFLAEDALMAPVGSDFSIVPYRRIMDVACTVARARLVNYLQGKILVDPTTGFIQESFAQAMESDVGSELRGALVNEDHASSARIVVTRDNNILSTGQLLVETRVIPPGYGKEIIHTIGFLNPSVTTS